MARSKRKTARGARPSVLTEENFLLLEGRLQEIRSKPFEERPKQLPVDYLSTLLGVQRVTVQAWLSKSRVAQPKDKHLRFAELYDQFALVFAANATTKVFDLAYDPKHPQQGTMLKWLLPKIDREWGDPVAERPKDDAGYGTVAIPRDVLDDLTEAELLEIEQYQEAVNEAMDATAGVIKRARARVAQKALEQH